MNYLEEIYKLLQVLIGFLIPTFLGIVVLALILSIWYYDYTLKNKDYNFKKRIDKKVDSELYNYELRRKVDYLIQRIHDIDSKN